MSTYITTDDLRSFMGSQNAQLRQDVYEDAVEGASREVEQICGRSFFADTIASARTYFPCSYAQVDTDDISSTSGLLVAVDSDGNGTFDQSWTITTDFYLEPVNPTAGGISRPYNKLTATFASKTFIIQSYQYQRPTVQVTALWGWPAVPKQVVQATKILAARQVALGSATLDVYGGNEFGAMRVAPQSRSALNLLRPFMLDEYAVA